MSEVKMSEVKMSEAKMSDVKMTWKRRVISLIFVIKCISKCFLLHMHFKIILFLIS